MRYIPKNAPEDYIDPQPVGYCQICGEKILYGDDCYEVPAGIVHSDGTYRTYKEVNNAHPLTLSLSCLWKYIMDNYSDEDILDLLDLKKKVWC